jgi:hypothetical protein
MKRENLFIAILTLIIAILSGLLVSIGDDYSIIATGFICGILCVCIMVYSITNLFIK